MNYLSVCSGVEAATVAWHHMGWNPVGFGEIEKFPSQVLAHHYPNVTNFGDMTKYKEWQIDGTIGLLVGGTPCQSFSVAGLRKGLEDPRGNLALTYVGILDHFRPKWFVWENVPGVLSSGGGRDFGSFLGAVVECGYGFAYRVLDAQYFGVPQRRRRVFVVGCLGDWRPPAKVLFEPESLRRNLAQSRNKGQGTSGYVESSFGQYRQDVIAGTTKASGGALAGGSETLITTASGKQQFGTLMANAGTKQWLGNQEAFSGDYHILQKVYENHPSDSRVREMGEVCQTVTSTWGSGGGNIPFVQNIAYEWHNQDSRIKPIEVAATLNCNAGGKEGHLVQSIGFTQCDAARDVGDNISPTLRSGGNGGYPAHSVAYGFEPGIAKREGNPNRFSEEISPTLRAEMGDNQVSMANNMAVRRLTPVECERLQGFPDNYTNIRENCPDGPRYKAMGNSMAVPVMRWIGERINKANNEQ
jgi:DNA (cytosine-5)-methyltransferase 1